MSKTSFFNFSSFTFLQIWTWMNLRLPTGVYNYLFSWPLAASMRSKEKDKFNHTFVELKFHDEGGLFLSF